eukprot:TRINITY_DN483_c0_g3_i1.p1 TRINITY_DN483_c0_g3~~TRINITY_DN483_c0_g3_i1.p1  ORF type:complete len:401 (-),score=79.49 TRINITY_DN483_c0_g3_i1:103-1146(-)
MDGGPAIIDLHAFLSDPHSKEASETCKQLVDTLRETSCLIIKDPRVIEKDNEAFLNLMERYFSQPIPELMKDVRPDLSYQLGATPENTEVPRDHHEVLQKLVGENQAHSPMGPDKKWRFFWRIGERPSSTTFPELNAPPVIPKSFPEWSSTMDRWGNLMLSAVRTVSEMIAVGFKLPPTTITDLLNEGPHLLAPTGSDLNKWNAEGTIFAGFHYDFNLLTIHGRSRFPGLYIWLRNGKKVLVRVPPGCLLLQAGKQLEWITGGEITAGFHEVIVSPETTQAIQKAKDEGRPLWRISSTLFSHVNSDKELNVLPPFVSEEALKKYPKILAGKQAEDELTAINLAATKM